MWSLLYYTSITTVTYSMISYYINVIYGSRPYTSVCGSLFNIDNSFVDR